MHTLALVFKTKRQFHTGNAYMRCAASAQVSRAQLDTKEVTLHHTSGGSTNAQQTTEKNDTQILRELKD